MLKYRGTYFVSVVFDILSKRMSLNFKVAVWFHWAMPTYFIGLFLRDVKKYVKVCKHPILKSFFDINQSCLLLKIMIYKINILFTIVSMIKFLLRTQINLTLYKVWQRGEGEELGLWHEWVCQVLALSGFSDESYSVQFFTCFVWKYNRLL